MLEFDILGSITIFEDLSNSKLCQYLWYPKGFDIINFFLYKKSLYFLKILPTFWSVNYTYLSKHFQLNVTEALMMGLARTTSQASIPTLSPPPTHYLLRFSMQYI